MKQTRLPASSVAGGQSKVENGLPGLISALGFVLAISYPVLALSTGVRSLYQLLFKEGVVDYLPPALSGVAALSYLVATIGFAYRRGWAWRLSVAVLAFETFMTLAVGGLSFIYPELIGQTVWRHFGADYGYFPLIQPLLGLAWLLWPETRRAYGLLGGAVAEELETAV